MPYNSETSEYERRSTTVIDATPDGDTVAVAIDVKLDQGIDDYVTDLNHHATNGRHYPATSVASDSRFLKQSPAGVVSWADGVVAADAALKDFSNVAAGAIASDKLASVAPAKITQDASNRFMTDAERTKLSGIEAGAQVNVAPTKEQVEAALTSSTVLKADATATLTKGFAAGTTAAANVSGTFTPAVADGNIRSFTLTANGTLACPSAAGSYAFVVNRSDSLFTLSLSGFDKVSGTSAGQWVLVSVVKTATRSVAFVDNI